MERAQKGQQPSSLCCFLACVGSYSTAMKRRSGALKYPASDSWHGKERKQGTDRRREGSGWKILDLDPNHVGRNWGSPEFKASKRHHMQEGENSYGATAKVPNCLHQEGFLILWWPHSTEPQKISDPKLLPIPKPSLRNCLNLEKPFRNIFLVSIKWCHPPDVTEI